MEIEYKWKLPDKETCLLLSKLLHDGTHVSGNRTVRMLATYYDTPDCLVRDMRGGLRIRRENDRRICCLKLAVTGADGCKTRQEYEVEAQDICDGLERLPGAGAPVDTCARILAGNPRPICETDFVRDAYDLETGLFRAEFAIDRGEMRHNGKRAHIGEIELEFTGGSEDAFHEFATQMQHVHHLEAEPLSKLARAMAL